MVFINGHDRLYVHTCMYIKLFLIYIRTHTYSHNFNDILILEIVLPYQLYQLYVADSLESSH